MFQFELVQIFSETNNYTFSTLNLVHGNGLNRLYMNPTVLRSKEGDLLNKSLFSFAIYIKSKVSATLGKFVNYRESLFTRIVCEQGFGGNCLTLVLIQLHEHEEKDCNSEVQQMYKTLMDFSMILASIRNYPLINEDVVIGLSAKFRSEIHYLRNSLTGSMANSSTALDNLMVANENSKVQALESKMIQENLEKLKLAEERNRLSNALMELTEKYKALVMKHSQLQETVTHVEEQRRVAVKSLSELKEEHSTMTLVTVKKLQADIEQRRDTLQSVEESLKTVTAEYQDLVQEYTVLKKNFAMNNVELKQAKTKIDELHFEMVSLIQESEALKMDLDLKKKMEKEYVVIVVAVVAVVCYILVKHNCYMLVKLTENHILNIHK